ncbi:polysaccharide biosynthesis/export family protein [Desulfobulbus alkaliphilus]|uniref:polysaccharide biosynthesis/export family protein n=1 Tax=Desulfobulbus alkaliphilus TaxID=869814 RepID=UPI0019660154|nr:polysaccharide biosynthesis/export family protein [Desulfobulbus alkaliphilus]MBM9537389.1 SLBB domain-containing protein [Desulfobulbus alkaliphilus]
MTLQAPRRGISPLFSLFLVLVLLATLTGCAKEQFQATTDVETFQRLHLEVERENNQREALPVTAAILHDDSPGDYILGAGDLIAVSVFQVPELNAEVRVSSRGFVSLPLLNNVEVANLSAAEAEELIENLYRERYLHNPNVTVYIKEHVSKQITLVGALSRPGTYDYIAKRRLLDVIAIANGLNDKAGSIAYVNRQDPISGQPVNYQVDLDELIKRGNMAQNMAIQGGDVIFVPESGQAFIDGAVRKPGIYSIRSQMTVTEGIALAGGLASYADADSIKLIRYMGPGRQREILKLSYTDLQGGVGDGIVLKDQDIIFAESSSSGTFVSGTGFSLGFMGTGINFRDPK